MKLQEKHQLAHELSMEFIRQNKLFCMTGDVKDRKLSLNEMSRKYFDMYAEFRCGIEEFSKDFSYGEDGF